jgi:galactokinase
VVEVAQACRQAEEIATGVPCGIMDQLTSLAGRRNGALLIDCRSLEIEPVELPGDLAVLVVHSGVSRALADGAYAERRRSCEAAAVRLGLDSLRDATPSQRDDFEVSTPELDALVEALVEAGALGARLTGAGFGGCVVALASRDDATGILERATDRYRAETGREPTAFVCRAVDGAGPLIDEGGTR